jgi:putative ABC transport system permease protein
MNVRLIAARLHGRLFRRRLDRELNDEIAFHLAQEARMQRALGLDDEEAVRAARRRFGNLTATTQLYRETGGMPTIDSLMQDLGYGFRTLIRQPGFAAVAVLSLAFGIGANSAVFTIVNASLLGSLPYPEPGRLVQVWAVPHAQPEERALFSVLEYQTWRDESRSFSALGTMFGGVMPRNVGTGQDGLPPERLVTQGISAGMWAALGVAPALGRVYTEAEDRVGEPPSVAVLGHEYWQRRFGGDRGVLGRTITLDDAPATIVGVMPPAFGREFFGPIDLWTPTAFNQTNVASAVRYLSVVARLKPEVSLEQAQAELDGLAAGFAEQYPERNRDWGVTVEPLQASLVSGLREQLLILQGAVALVLLIACANVAGMLLARGASRQSEVALRNALGASRLRIGAQLLMEGIPLALLGGGAGLGLAGLAIRLIPSLMPPDPALSEVSLDARVLVFTSLVALVCVVVFGTVPAVQSSRPDLGLVLSDGGRGRTDSGRRQRFRSVLVVSQLALALVLLTGAGLLVNSFARLLRNDVGIEPAGVMTFDYQFSFEGFMTPLGQFEGVGLWDVSPELEESFERVYERLQRVPGVELVAGANRPPLDGGALDMPFEIDGAPPVDRESASAPTAAYYGITPGYFATLGVPIRLGRDFEATDRSTSKPVVIVSQALADAYWPGQNPIGRTLTLRFVPDEPSREIVGVVGNTRVSRFDRQPARILYVPFLQHTRQWRGPNWFERVRMAFLLRGAGDQPMRLVPDVQRAVAEVDPVRPAAGFQMVDDYLGSQVQDMRAQMILFGLFGGIALALAAVGLYGVMAYIVAQRTREIGIRIALGSPVYGVVSLVGGHALRLVVAGLVVGLIGALALTRVIASALWGVTATDPFTFGGVAALLFATALVACLLPVRRALRVDPIDALRVT